MYKYIEYQSSPMSWCESKFVYSNYIIEFWNSLTSLLFVFLSYQGYKLSKNKFIWCLYSLIGFTSCLFHSTLSFIGQFLDELSIIIYIYYN